VADQIKTIALLTCDRLPGLLRALESYIGNVKKYGRSVEFAVFDDARDPAKRETCRAELRRLKQKHAVVIRYAGLEEKKTFAEALEKDSGVDRSLIDFALFDPLQTGYTPGANRNATLLHTAGEMFYSADDDTVCEFYAMANHRPDFAITSDGHPTELHFFRDQKSALAAAIRTEKNLLAMVEDMLGCRPKDLIASTGQPPDIKAATPKSAQCIQSDTARVLVNWIGIFGDSGYVNPTFLLGQLGESRRRLLRGAEFYESIKQNRQIFRAPIKRTFGPGPFCQTTALGLDNRELLPPFLPVFRGEDFSFGNLLSRCWDNAVFGYLPWGIRHEPLTPRINQPGDILLPATYVNFFQVLEVLVKRYQAKSADSHCDPLADCGDFLQHLAQNEEAFSLSMSEAVYEHHQNLLRSYRFFLEMGNETPDYWAKDVRDFISATEKAKQSREYLIPREVRGRDNCLELCRILVQRLGRLLVAWPTMLRAAKKLACSDQRLARPIN
jgi:hypothetical protein